MTPNRSSSNGKALEYLLTEKLLEDFRLEANGSTMQRQIADKPTFTELPLNRRLDLARNVQWISETLQPDIQGMKWISRQSDQRGEEGDPTDLLVSAEFRELHLSLKSNNESIKHQRLRSLPKQMGLDATSNVSESWTSSLDSISSNYWQIHHPAQVSVTTDQMNTTFLYELFAEESCKLLSKFAHDNSVALHLYRFLVGPVGLKTVKSMDKGVQIYDWSQFKDPTQFEVTQVHEYLHLDFDNGHVLKLRLHTSERVYTEKNLNFKWDTRSVSEPSILASVRYK